MDIIVRQATGADASAATEVLRRSITELCVADHQNDAAKLDPWLANKTVENIGRWISSERNYCVVALIGGEVSGFGMMTLLGEIQLCYVHPPARFRGVSRALLEALEQRARMLGLRRLGLQSTATARRFYEARGFVPIGPPASAFALISCQSMVKELVLMSPQFEGDTESGHR